MKRSGIQDAPAKTPGLHPGYTEDKYPSKSMRRSTRLRLGMRNISITALVIGGLEAGFAAGALIDTLAIFGLGFSSPARLRRRHSSVVLLGLPGVASPGVISPGRLSIVATHRATTRVLNAVRRPHARRTHQQGQYDHCNSHDDLLL